MPNDVRLFVERMLAATGEKKNRDFREAIGVGAGSPTQGEKVVPAAL